MRHGTWTDFSFFSFLFQISFWYILPWISIQSNQYRISRSYLSKHSTKTIVRLNLSCIEIRLKTKILLNKRFWYGLPIQVRICEIVSIKISNSSVEFSINFGFVQLTDLQRKSICEVGILLSNGCRWCRLTMCMGKHDMRRPFLTLIDKIIQNFMKFWQYDMIDRIFKHETIWQVIDILAGTTEMDTFFVVIYVVFYEVLNGFQVMIYCLLNLLYLLSGSKIEIIYEVIQLSLSFLIRNTIDGLYDLIFQHM